MTAWEETITRFNNALDGFSEIVGDINNNLREINEIARSEESEVDDDDQSD